MALTTTATFDKYNLRKDIAGTYIIKITGDSTTFYLADRVIDLSASSIKTLGVVLSYGTITQKLDIFKKKATISNVKVKLINTPYFRDANGELCLSDKFGADGIINASVEIYYWYEGITDIDDCLKVFDGLVQPMKNVTPETLEFDIFDNSVFYYRTIPADFVDITQFPNAPPESIGKALPIVFGDFDMDTENVGRLSEGVWIALDKIAFAGHKLKSITSVWVYDTNLNKLVKLESTDYTVTLDDSGISTVQIDDMNACDAHFYHLPNREDVVQDDDYPTYPYFNMERGRDLDLSTEGQVKVPDEPSGFFWDIDGTCDWYFSEVPEDAGTVVNAWMEAYFHVYDGGGTQYDTQPTLAWGAATIDITFANDDQWKTVALGGFAWDDFGDHHIAQVFDYRLHPDDTELLLFGIQELRIHVQYTCKIQTEWRIFAECEGRVYGSWIDDGGRSNSYNQNDLIENPAHIIESILREDLGLVSADIDTDSFDDVGGDLTSWDILASITHQIRTDLLFSEIGLQSKIHAFFSSQGVAKIDMLDDSVTTEDDTFSLNDVNRKGWKLTQGDMKELINSVDIFYDQHPLFGFQALLSATNSTSISDFNITRHKSINANFIKDSAVAISLKNHILGTTGYWKDLQEYIEVKMHTFKFIPWELGELIEPDSSFDAIMKLFSDNFGSASFSPFFMVIMKKMGKDLTFGLKRMGSNGPPA